VPLDKLEQALGRELVKSRMADERKRKDIERVCAQSEEIKEMQRRVKAALTNKERCAQIAEN
jgi:hypothetical protein